MFPALPTLGLSGLLHLKTFNNPALREFPSPERFPRVQTMVLSYAYHCCSFLSIEVEEPVTKSSIQESILFPTDNEFDMSLWNSSFSDIWPQLSKWPVPVVFDRRHRCIIVHTRPFATRDTNTHGVVNEARPAGRFSLFTFGI